MRLPEPQPGARVRVPFGRQRLIGVVHSWADSSEVPREKLKPLLEVIDDAPVIDAGVMELVELAAQYYHHPLGEVMAAALPKLARDGAAARALTERWFASASGIAALDSAALNRAPRQRELLGDPARRARDPGRVAGRTDSPTGARRCARWWRAALRRPRRYPKIRRQLMAPTAARARGPHSATSKPPPWPPSTAPPGNFRALPAAWHHRQRQDRGVPARGRAMPAARAARPGAGARDRAHAAARGALSRALRGHRSRCCTRALTDTERLAAWRQCVSGEARVVLGTRSAVFAPVADLGIVIVDEEHDASFKQHESGFRYSARDLAILRAQRAAVPIVLGSATPSLETLQNVAAGKYQRLSLPRRAGQALPPRAAVIDLREHAVRAGHRHAGRRGHAAPSRRRRPGAGVHQPARLLADAGLHGLRLDRALPRLRRAAHRASRPPRVCVATTAAPMRRCPPSARNAATPCAHVGQGTERVEETLADTVSRHAHRTPRPRRGAASAATWSR